MSKTKIEWVKNSDGSQGRVWNPVTGCTPISPGCGNCYAKRMTERFAGPWGLDPENPFAVKLQPERLGEPLRWKKPSMVFVCSMSDLFHEDVPDAFIGRIWAQMLLAKSQTYLVLTKRPERMARLLAHRYQDEVLPNVWLGVTAENQEQADKRIPILLSIPATKHFVSVEPMLGPVDLTKVSGNLDVLDGTGKDENAEDKDFDLYEIPYLDWVICGGESGPNARPMHPDWARGLRDQCKASGTPFLFKQWGEWLPISQMPDGFCDTLYPPPPERDPERTMECKYLNGALQPSGELLPVHTFGAWRPGAMQTFKIGKRAAGRQLDGQLWNRMPEVTQNARET